MTILINGSPKGDNSASATLLKDLKNYLPKDMETKETTASTYDDTDKVDTIVIAFPLYVDGIPSHVLRMMESIKIRGARVYAICNCGFFEGTQCKTALKIVENWCAKEGLLWKGGIGIGGGGALGAMPNGGPKKPICEAIKSLAESITEGTGGENIYVSVGMPRILYKTAAEIGWKKQIKANGLKKEDLSRRL